MYFYTYVEDHFRFTVCKQEQGCQQFPSDNTSPIFCNSRPLPLDSVLRCRVSVPSINVNQQLNETKK